MSQTWRTYEEVARQLLADARTHFGIDDVEGKQGVDGNMSGTSWEIDAKGVDTATGQFVIVECRRYTTSRLNQEDLGGLAWRILDTGAKGGIVVSPLRLQAGAEMVAKAANVVHVQLNETATPTEFEMRFLDQIRVGFYDEAQLKVTDQLTLTLYRNGELVSVEVVGDGADTA